MAFLDSRVGAVGLLGLGIAPDDQQKKRYSQHGNHHELIGNPHK